jgi:hypothetical protein
MFWLIKRGPTPHSLACAARIDTLGAVRLGWHQAGPVESASASQDERLDGTRTRKPERFGTATL